MHIVWNVKSVTSSMIEISRLGSIVRPEDAVYVSSSYLESISCKYVVSLAYRQRDITIFHVGFPEVPPIIVNYDTFALHASTTITHSDGAFSAQTTVALSESDVKYFQYLMDDVGSVARTPSQIIMKRNITSAVVQMLEELGIDYVTEKLFV